MRLEGWPRATVVQAAILRDASHRPKGEGLLLRMRSENPETIGFLESIHGSSACATGRIHRFIATWARGVLPVDWGGDIEAIGEFGERWDW
jgi:hypothetical protein